MMKSFFLIILQASCALYAQSQSGYDSIDNAVRSFMAEKKIPGFAACVVNDKTISWSNAYGEADIRSRVPMNIDGIMNIGSISKTFTTAAAMQLWEKGLLDLDADINKYLDIKIRNPKHPDKPITIFQILTHTSTIIDGKAYSHSYSCGDPTLSLYDWIKENLTPGGKYYYEGTNFGDWEPGGKERYSNVAFGLLGLIVERVARQPFNEYCKEHIFTPLGMKNTGWMLSEIDTAKHIKPYAYVTVENRNDLLENKRLHPGESAFKAGSYVEHCLYSFPNYPDGLVRTSIRELSFYLTAMMNGGELNGKRILKKETVTKMLSSQIDRKKNQGLTWHTHEFESLSGRIALWGHTGGDPGISTYLFFDPVKKIGVITFQNNATDGTFRIVEKLYLAEAFGRKEILPRTDLLPQKGVMFDFNRKNAKLLDEFIKTHMAFYQIPGASLALIKKGKVIYHNFYGVKNSISKQPVDENTIFEAGSITKPVFAFVVMRLVEKGILDLDKPLYQYLPFKDVEHDDRYKLITARYVLSHRTGFPNWAQRNEKGQFDLRFTPGTSYGYSGEGFEYLKRVVEHITRKDIDLVLQEELIAPLHWKNVYFKGSKYIADHEANGHNNNAPTEIRIVEKPQMAYSMITEARSFSTFMLALRNKKALQPESYMEMFKIHSTLEAGVHWSLGFCVEDSPYGVVYRHGGSTSPGFICNFSFFPDIDMGYVLFTNSDKGEWLSIPLLTKFLITGK